MLVQNVVEFTRQGYKSCCICYAYCKCINIELNGEHYTSVCDNCLTKVQVVSKQEVAPSYTSKDRKRTNKKAKKSEVKTASETGGRCTGYIPLSGDSRNSRFFFEDKTKISGDRKSYRLTQDVVLKGRSQATKAGLTPVFRIHLKDISIGAMLWDDLVELVREDQ